MSEAVDRTDGDLDAAVLAYRGDPSEENRQRVLRASEEHVRHFVEEQTGDYQRRTA